MLLFILSIFLLSFIQTGISEFHHPSNMSIIALILARGGSKGVHRKNLYQLNGGDSLLRRTMKTVKESELFSEIWISSEDEEIIGEAMNFGAFTHIRPMEFAMDRTTSLEAVAEFLMERSHVNNLALIQCTSVFLKIDYLRAAFEKFKNSDCVFSVTRSYKLRWKKTSSSEFVEPINFDPKNRPRRQDLDGEFIENGMFYFTNRELILKYGAFQNKKCKTVEIPQIDSLEIDNYADIKIAEILLLLENKGNLKTEL